MIEQFLDKEASDKKLLDYYQAEIFFLEIQFRWFIDNDCYSTAIDCLQCSIKNRVHEIMLKHCS